MTHKPLSQFKVAQQGILICTVWFCMPELPLWKTRKKQALCTLIFLSLLTVIIEEFYSIRLNKVFHIFFASFTQNTRLFNFAVVIISKNNSSKPQNSLPVLVSEAHTFVLRVQRCQTNIKHSFNNSFVSVNVI